MESPEKSLLNSYSLLLISASYSVSLQRMGQLTIYKASAGSGKTFTLAIEYIKHLIKYPRAYRRILAVTFTNKATAEMKERILGQLYGIHAGDKQSTPYLEKIISDTKYSEKEVRTAAGQALANILHDYSNFRIETIDSFFQSVVRNLARELELSPNLNIELSQEDILSEAVDSMIEKLQPDSPVLAWLLEYIDDKISNDKRWNVSDEIKKFAQNIFNEEYIEKGSELREKLKTPQAVRNYRRSLTLLMDEALQEMKALGNDFDRILAEDGLSPEELKNGWRGIGSYFRKIQEGNLSESVCNATVTACLADEKNWCAKTSARYHEITSLAASQLIPLLIKSEDLRRKNNHIVNSCRLSIQHLNKLQLLTGIDEEVRLSNKEHNRFLLSDTNVLLHRLVGDNDSSFVFEKIGSSIRNVMIDEFQDTSRMQWGNFKLLLLEGLSHGADSLIVGDVKQSIYRWRNGDWGILNGLNDRLGHFPLRVETLTTNRRSESNVIRFNNNLFTAAVDYLNNRHKQELGHPCEPLEKAYQDVVQQSVREPDKGYVKVLFPQPDDENDYTEKTLESMAQEVRRLLDAGVQMNDIAILVRKNKSIPRIAEYFDKEMNCNIVSDEAFRFDASLSVCLMIDALRMLSDPADKIACARLVVAYQNGVLQKDLPLDDLLTATPTEYLPEAFVKRYSDLSVMTIYELFEELFKVFGLEKVENQDAYLFAFYDAVMVYLKDNPSDYDSFIRFWDKKLCSRTIPGGEIEGIRIFSIHKSKGLEFHSVLVPFCDWKLESEIPTGHLVWCTADDSPYNELELVPVNYSSTMSESTYREAYLNERLQLWVDSLNMLYVAFTRAKKNLIVWTRNGKKGTVSEVLANALLQVAEKESLEWTPGDDFELGTILASGSQQKEHTDNKLTRKPSSLPISMRSFNPDIRFRQSNHSANFIKGEDAEKMDTSFLDRGRLLHTVFSSIRSTGDIDKAVDRLIFNGIIADEKAAQNIRTLVRRAFDAPAVSDWYSGTWRLFNECAIIYKQNGKVEIRRPDRVMMKEDRVVVVDFKFGKPQGKYKRQVQEYMDLLRRMKYDNVDGYLWYAEEGVIEEVRSQE